YISVALLSAERLRGPPCSTETEFAANPEAIAMSGSDMDLWTTVTPQLPTRNSEEPQDWPSASASVTLWLSARMRIGHGKRNGGARPIAPGQRAAELSSARQAQRLDLQHRLRVLLLFVEGGAVPQRQTPHVGGHARQLHPPIARGPSHARGDRRVAGRGADADEARVLREGGRTGRKISKTRPDGPANLSDQRPPSRRRLVRLLQEAQFSGWPQ